MQKKIRHILKTKRNLKLNTVYVVENQNEKYFNLLGLKDVKFVPVADSKNVFLTMRGNEQYYGIRDRDYLSDNEIYKLKKKFPNYIILDYYCFENYLYHPDNIESLMKESMDKEIYKAEIIKQKNKKLTKVIIPNIKPSRNNYEEFKISSENIKDKDIDSIIDNLESEDFERFYKSFDMKKIFTKEILEKSNISENELARTNWFKKKMIDLLKKSGSNIQ